jgi:hypothetical protein
MMIDFTTIQTNPIPPSILKLQKQNSDLNNNVLLFRSITITFVFGVITLLIYTSYANKRKKEHSGAE